MLHTTILQRYAKTILIALAVIAFLVVSVAAKNDQRVNAQAGAANSTGAIQDSKPVELAPARFIAAPAAATSTPEAARNTQHVARIASRTIQYTYDNAGRLTNVNYVGAQSIAYTYDAAGNLIQAGTGDSKKYVYLPLIRKTP